MEQGCDRGCYGAFDYLPFVGGSVVLGNGSIPGFSNIALGGLGVVPNSQPVFKLLDAYGCGWVLVGLIVEVDSGGGIVGGPCCEGGADCYLAEFVDLGGGKSLGTGSVGGNGN